MNRQDRQFYIKDSGQILALSGGVGGAKLALGLSKILAPEQLTIVANTADDFNHLGLSISPDLDTLMYTLAGINHQDQGWGLSGESWNTMDALEILGGDSWFRLGDRDLATHIERTQRLAQGQSLSEITNYFCQRLGVEHRITPMTDDCVSTRITLANHGDIAQYEQTFQEYFVREQCQPEINGFYFEGIERARPQARLMSLLKSDQLSAIIICPSNPFVSVEPILQLTGVRQALQQSSAPVIAISPIVAGRAIKGPTAKMMAELDMPVSALSVADYYGLLLDGFVIDQSDRALYSSIADRGIEVCCLPTVMHTLNDRIDLAQAVLSFAHSRFSRSDTSFAATNFATRA